jgi:uncharacterized protein YaaW (UPF0174 family)
MLSLVVTEVMLPLVALKLLRSMVPTMVSSKVTVKVMASLVMAPLASVMVLTEGARVSMDWLPNPLKSALTSALPDASLRPAATRLRATLPEAILALGVTTTV